MLERYATKEDLRKYVRYVSNCLLYGDDIDQFDNWARDHYGEEGVPYAPEPPDPERPEEKDLPFT